MIEFILYVKDQKESEKFYQELLEKKPVLSVPGMTEFLLAENVKLGLMPESGIAKIIHPALPHPESGNGIPRCELYLYSENVKETHEKIKKLGIKMVDELQPRDWGDDVFYISDPDGHVIAFAEKK